MCPGYGPTSAPELVGYTRCRTATGWTSTASSILPRREHCSPVPERVDRTIPRSSRPASPGGRSLARRRPDGPRRPSGPDDGRGRGAPAAGGGDGGADRDGRPGGPAGELRARAVAHRAGDPLREQAALALMRALAADGAAAEALRVSREFRERLAEETGLDPSPAIGDLEGQVARGASPRAHAGTIGDPCRDGDHRPHDRGPAPMPAARRGTAGRPRRDRRCRQDPGGSRRSLSP